MRIEELLFAGGAGLAHRRSDAAAGRRDLRVGRSFDSLLELGRAVAGEDRVCVCVDEAGQNDAAVSVYYVRFTGDERFNVRSGAGGDDPTVAHQHRAIVDDGEIAHPGPGARARSARQGHQLPAVDDRQFLHPAS